MRLKETTRVRLMSLHGLAMIVLGLGLLYIRATMTNSFSYFFGVIFALLLVAASLLFISVVDWICAASLGVAHLAKLRGLLFLSTAAAAASILLLLYPGATIEALGYTIAVYALLLGIGKAYMARYWLGTEREQVVMWALALIAFAFSGTLFSIGSRDERDILGIIALYSLFMGIQMFLSMSYLQRNVRTLETASPRSKPAQP